MIVEMTTAEQQQYLRHDNNSGSRLTPLTPMMPNRNPRSTKLVGIGKCPDTRNEEKLQGKGAQHKACEEAFKDCGYNVTTLPLIIGQSGSQCHTTCNALVKVGGEHGSASKLCPDCTKTLFRHLGEYERARRQKKADRTGQIHLFV